MTFVSMDNCDVIVVWLTKLEEVIIIFSFVFNNFNIFIVTVLLNKIIYS